MRAELQSRQALWLGLAVFAYALGLRAIHLGAYPFHMDEALYAGFSRRILQGDLLLTGGLNNDKPPLQFYLGAVSMGFFGEREGAARLLNAVVSALECGLLSWALWPLAGLRGALLAGLLLATSPLGVGFGSSLLMDGPLSLLMLISVLTAMKGRAGLSGLAWALACAAKQTAYFLLPLPLLALALSQAPLTASAWSFVRGSAYGLVPLWVWSAAFQHPRLGMVLLMKANQPEVGLGSAAGAGLGTWLEAGRHGFIFPGLLLPALGLGLLLLPWKGFRPWMPALLAGPWLLVLFIGLGMRPFERYWLPALPFLAAVPTLLLAAWPRWGGRIALALCLVVLWQGRHLSFEQTQAGLSQRNPGFREICERLRSEAPQGGLLGGDAGGLHWLGNWYLGKGWTLFEKPDASTWTKAVAEAGAKPVYWVSQDAATGAYRVSKP